MYSIKRIQGWHSQFERLRIWWFEWDFWQSIHLWWFWPADSAITAKNSISDKLSGLTINHRKIQKIINLKIVFIRVNFGIPQNSYLAIYALPSFRNYFRSLYQQGKLKVGKIELKMVVDFSKQFLHFLNIFLRLGKHLHVLALSTSAIASPFGVQS